MARSNVLLAFVGLLGYPIAQAFTKCPTTETTFTSSDASKYAICPNADYQGTTVNAITAISSNSGCAALCNQYANCTQANFDKLNYVCHLKTGTQNWVTNAQYETIRFVSRPATNSTIISCPYGEKNVSVPSGSSFSVCPNTEFTGPSISNVGSVSSEADCASLCDQSTKCKQAVYDTTNLICHIKDGSVSTGLPWVFNTQYKTISLVNRPTQGSVISTCPYGEQNMTSTGGLGFAVCPQSDYQGPSTLMLTAIKSAEDCANQCGQQLYCTKAVHDASGSICHIEGNSTTNPWVFNANYTSIRLVNGTSDSGPQFKGSWSGVINLPVIPVGAFIVPEQPQSQRMLVFSSWGAATFSGPTGITQFADYNFVTGAVSARSVTNTQHDMFCPAISTLQDGRVVIQGGENAEAVSIYDPLTNNFTRGPDMKIPRGYQSSTTLSDGKIFTVGGSFTGGLGGKVGEVFDPVANSWTLLPGADVTPILTKDVEGIFREDNHAWLYGWSNGSVFQAGPSMAMNWYSTSGTGSVTAAGTRQTDNDTMCGVNVMYDAGKIFAAGGSQNYTNSAATAEAHLITITSPHVPATVERLPDMTYPRGFANVVVLPDGKVLVTGGQVKSLVFTDVQSVLNAELWDPATKKFTLLAPQTIGRNYHSVSLLLADGTVFSGGGGMCPVAYLADDSFCDKTISHPNGEIFSPPYLFDANGNKAVRPTITSLSSSSSAAGLNALVGSTLTVGMGDESGSTFSLVRLGTVTHSVNTDQRRIALTSVVQNKAMYTIKLPADSGILLPGYYYLFAISKTGVPSIARTLQVHA